jgi:hypothetical protein
VGRRTAFPLSRRPDPDSLSVGLETTDALASGDPPTKIVRDVTMQDGWTWHEESNTIRLWGEAIPSLGASVLVRYVVGVGG